MAFTYFKKYIKMSDFFFWLLFFIPISLIFEFIIKNHTYAFITSIIAIIPLARILGYVTQEISLQTNVTIGGLLSATFGNIIELIIAVLAFRQGLFMVVKASIIGSIIGNLLLLIGLSIFFGGIKYKQQRFNRLTTGVSSTMLIIALIGLAIPTLFAIMKPGNPNINLLSDFVAIILALTYVAGLIFSLLTHKDMYDVSDELKATKQKPTLNLKTAAIILLITTAFVALESEFLVSGINSAAHNFGIPETFIGLVIIAVLTNIAEKASAIQFAIENKLDLSLEIGMSSAIQIALFVVPILVLISVIYGYGFNLVFSMFDIIAMLAAVMIVNHLATDGRCNWLEGVQLLSVYLIIAITFFFI